MNHLITTVVAALAILLSGCSSKNSGSGISAEDRLKWYFAYIPPDLKIEMFHESPSPAMDHYYLWKIKITEHADYQKFEAQITNKPTNRDGGGVDTGIITDDYPKWWKNENLESMEGYRFTGNANGRVYAMFDRKASILFLQVCN